MEKNVFWTTVYFTQQAVCYVMHYCDLKNEYFGVHMISLLTCSCTVGQMSTISNITSCWKPESRQLSI